MLQIRPFQRKDINGLVSLWKLFQITPSAINSPSLPSEMAVKEWKRSIFKNYKSDSTHILVAEKDKQLVGYLLLQIRLASEVKKLAFVKEIFVHPNYRKHRVGTQLLQQGIKYLKEKNIKYICVKVWFQNMVARKFYKKFGFEEYMLVLQKKLIA